MKTQTLVMTLAILVSGSAFATPNLFAPSKSLQQRCDGTEGQDVSVQIRCEEESTQYLERLNNHRIAVLSQDSRLKHYGLQDQIASVKAFRASTEARKKIFCSLKSAPNPFGGRMIALGNRECFLQQELQLEKELIQIKQLFDETARGFQEQGE